MDSLDYYNDKKWCPACDGYVSYLMSVEHSYCVECGGEVRLFSKEDWESFAAEMAERRPKSSRRRGRGKKAAGDKRESA